MKNNKIEIMFRKSFQSGLGGLDWLLNVLIGIFDWSKYSHVELVMPSGISVSSTFKDGVRYTERRTKGKWYSFVIYVSDETLNKLINEIHIKHGKKYDYIAVIRHKFPFLPNDPNRYYCSEFVTEVLVKSNILPNNIITELSVKQLFKILNSNLQCNLQFPLQNHHNHLI